MPGEMACYSIDIDLGRDKMFTVPCNVGCRVIRQRAGRRRKTETSVTWTNGGEVQLLTEPSRERVREFEG